MITYFYYLILVLTCVYGKIQIVEIFIKASLDTLVCVEITPLNQQKKFNDKTYNIQDKDVEEVIHLLFCFHNIIVLVFVSKVKQFYC